MKTTIKKSTKYGVGCGGRHRGLRTSPGVRWCPSRLYLTLYVYVFVFKYMLIRYDLVRRVVLPLWGSPSPCQDDNG